MTVVAEALPRELDPRITELASEFVDTPLAIGVLVFGRGSEEDPEVEGGRLLSDAGKERVRAVGAYLLAHADDLHAARVEEINGRKLEDTPPPRFGVLFSCGWAAGSGQQPPEDERYREASMMMGYAEETGILDRFQGDVRFGAQIESSSTIGDAVYAARSGFFGRGVARRASKERPFAIGSHEEHAPRCEDSTVWSFGLEREQVYQINARGEDLNTVGTPEAKTRALVRVGTFGAHHSHNRLLKRDALLIKTQLWAKKVVGRLLKPEPKLSSETI